MLLHHLPAEDEDLDLLHRHSLLKCPGAVLVADNVLSTAAVGLLWRTGRGTCMKLFMNGLGEGHAEQSLESIVFQGKHRLANSGRNTSRLILIACVFLLGLCQQNLTVVALPLPVHDVCC